MKNRKSFVLALVGPVGSLLSDTTDELEDWLSRYGYALRRVHLSRALSSLRTALADEAGAELSKESYFGGLGREYDRIRNAMARGTIARRHYLGENALLDDKNACLAQLAIHAIAEQRKVAPTETCYVVHSVKTRAELKQLRSVYGRRLIVLGVNSTRSNRQERLTSRIERDAGRVQRATEGALHLMGIDEKEWGTAHGQDVQGAFEQCDVYIDASRLGDDFRRQVQRLVKLLFQEPFEVATSDEAAMSYAYSASLRSSSMARQVGAAIATKSGDVLSVGFNETATLGGCFDPHVSGIDGRDRARGYDESSLQRRALLSQIVSAANDNQLLASGVTVENAVEQLESHAASKSMLWRNTTEFVREVHAEMVALTTAARLGTSVHGSTLFTTTFPCHNCAKHIVAAGIDEVVFIEPYPKSLAETFYSESISLDELRPGRVLVRAFRGVAPKTYGALFAWRDRRDTETGNVVRFFPRSTAPWFTARAHLSDEEVSRREERILSQSHKLGEVFELSEALKVLLEAPPEAARGGAPRSHPVEGVESGPSEPLSESR